MINSGIITASGSTIYAAGIGSACAGVCGNITAIGGRRAVGIGSGVSARCANITISENVDEVTASTTTSNLFREVNSIGAGSGGICGTVTIGSQVGEISESPYTYPPSGNVIEVKADSYAVVLEDGDVFTGTVSDAKVFIDDGAAIVLRNAQLIGSTVNTASSWPGLVCVGDATITLQGENSCVGLNGAPGIYVPEGKTLTIKGSGKLTAVGSGTGGTCGSITINDGVITAIFEGSNNGAGICSSQNGTCGSITINGGNILASSRGHAAGIGSGLQGE